MPAAIPIVGAVAGAFVSKVVGVAVGGAIIGSIVGAVAGGIVSTGVTYLGSKVFGKEPDKPRISGTNAASFASDIAGGGRTQMVRQPITSHRVVYGKTRVSGPVVFIHSRPASGTSDKLDILHVVIILAAHEVEAVEDIFFNDSVVALDGNGDATADPYKQGSIVYASAYKHIGTASQLADQVLVDNSGGKWSTGHRLRGLTYIHAQLRFDEKAYASGLPNISALVKGRKLYDPRTEETEWSENAALCILDYVMAEFGLGASMGEIDLASFIAAANICDEEVDTIDDTESRYTCNGVIDLAAKPRDILEEMLSSCAGFLTYTGGKWRLKVGAYTPPMFTLEPHHARESVMLKPHRSRRNLINTVRGAFISPIHQWQPTDYPEISNDAYVTQDGDEQAAATLDLPFTQSPTMAQRIAMIALEQNRRQKQILFPSNLVGFQLAAGNTIAIDLPRFGLAGLPCTVTTWAMTEDLGVDLTLDEDGPDIYEYSVSNLKSLDSSPEVVAPNNADVPPGAPQNIETEAGADYIHLSWLPVTDSDLRYIEVWEHDADTEDPQSDASRIMEVYGSEYTRTGLAGSSNRFYWLRSVDRYGNKSGFAGPVEDTTSGEASIVLVLE